MSLVIKYISHLGESLGYASAAYAHMRGFIREGILFWWDPFCSDDEQRTGEVKKSEFRQHLYFENSSEYQVAFFHLIPDYLPNLILQEKKKGKFLVGFATWESTILPVGWKEIFNQLDLLFVPCSWNRHIFRQSGVVAPVEVAPLIFDLPTLPKREDDAPRAPYAFYTIGDFSRRKGVEITLRTYLETFTKEDPVVLRVKTNKRVFGGRKTAQGAVNRILREYKSAPKVELIDSFLSRKEMLQLHADSHCYLSLFHAEGWGLGAFEAAGLGNPVIVTNFGGVVDFLPAGYPYGVDYRLVSIPHLREERNYQGSWAEPNTRCAARWMKEIFTEDRKYPSLSKTKGHLLGRELQKSIVERFSGGKIVSAMYGAISDYYYMVR